MNGADYYGIQGLPEKIMVLAASIAMSLLVFNLMRDHRWLRPIGKDSLFYYVYHTFTATLLLSIIRWEDFPRTLPFILLYTAASIALLWLMSKVNFFRWLVHPTFKCRNKEKTTE